VTTELLRYRDRFPILRETTYLVNHSLGAMPEAAEERLRAYAEAWRTRGVRAWAEGWWDTPLSVGDQVGRIVGAPQATTVMHQNVTVAAGVVLSAFSFDGERRRIMYVEGEFPSVRYLLQAQAARGAELVVCPDSDGLLEAIDERTLLVPISHVLFRTGELVGVEAIAERAREAGAYVLLDAYQSAGIVPLDVTALGVDFAVGGSVKWLCGGPGAGWLYVRPDRAGELRPTLVGWQAHARPFSFEAELEYAEGAARFLTGTPNVPALYAATAGYDIVEEVGVGQIRERSLALTGLLISLVEDAGFEVASPHNDERRGGTVVVRTPADEAVHRELDARSIICDFRPGTGIRFGPHFYNSEDEIRFAAAQLADIVETGAYRRHAGAAAAF
jgi:kynureninase